MLCNLKSKSYKHTTADAHAKTHIHNYRYGKQNRNQYNTANHTHTHSCDACVWCAPNRVCPKTYWLAPLIRVVHRRLAAPAKTATHRRRKTRDDRRSPLSACRRRRAFRVCERVCDARCVCVCVRVYVLALISISWAMGWLLCTIARSRCAHTSVDYFCLCVCVPPSVGEIVLSRFQCVRLNVSKCLCVCVWACAFTSLISFRWDLKWIWL